MTTNKITELLESLTELNAKIKKRLKKEEGFNIFRALHKESDEVRLHSRFISVLLSPYSSHKSDVFLKKFIELFEIKNFDLEGVKVFPSEFQKSEYKNIDILVINEKNKKNKKAIIIENKIYAGDSNNEEGGQLERYIDEIHKHKNIPLKNILVFYLTLTGHDPSDQSIGKYKNSDKVKLKTISYKTDIIQWLKSCLTELSQDSFIAECIKQYIKLLKDMTLNNTEINERIELRNLIGASMSNTESAKLLYDNFVHIKWHTVRNFWNELSNILKGNFSVLSEPYDDDVTKSTHNNSKVISYELKFKTSKQDVVLYVWSGQENPVCWGIFFDGLSDHQKSQIRNLNKFKELEDNFLAFFEKEEDKQVYLYDFSHQGTFNLINDNYRKNLIRGYANEIKKTIKILSTKKT